jgi:hypothetical protein
MVNNSNELMWEVIFVDIGGIVDITQWIEVRGDFCWYWWNCWHHSMNWGERGFLLILVELSHLITLSDGQQFHQYQQKSPLTLTHWVMVNNSTNINKNHLSLPLNELKWEVIFVDIGGIVNHHSMWLGERWFLLILVELLTITQINKNHLSLQLIEWWSTIPPISTKITSHFNSLSDGQQFH